MSIPSLLSTNTQNFLELLGNGRTYRVPQFQRDYSWGEEEWEDLWQDIETQRPDPNLRHYMGAAVFKAESDRSFLIIDGQQRMTTLTILVLAVIASLEDLSQATSESANRERAQVLRNRFIGEKDPASLTESSKLRLNEHDDGFFQDYLVQRRSPTNPRSLPKSNRLLWNCFSYFRARIAEDSELKYDGQKLAELVSEVVGRRLVFISIQVVDEINAYTVFETLNARGLELTATDLLKNYLFSRMHAPSDLEAVQRRWQRLVTTVRQDRFGDFLRYHYLTKYRKIRSGRLFKLVRDEVTSAQQVLDLLNELENRAELFDALFDPGHSLWIERPEAKPFIAELGLFRVRQMTPTLFAAYEKLDRQEFAKVLKCVSIISFRYTIIGSLNTNELEPVYHDAAARILDGSATTARGVFEVLRSVYVDDERFEQEFATQSFGTSGPRKKVAKYVLCKLESDASEREVNFDTDPGTIEHILPENPIDEWLEIFPDNSFDRFVYRLGNLTLLKASTNRDLAGAPYPVKLQAFALSEYTITRDIPEMAPTEWTEASIGNRQLNLAKRARHIWRLDF